MHYTPQTMRRAADEYGFEKLEAFRVLSQARSARVANVGDPNYTVLAKFPKALLPPKR